MKNGTNPTHKGVSLSLGTKIILSFVTLFGVTLLSVFLMLSYGIPFSDYDGEYSAEQSEAFRSLNLVAELKKERLVRWIKERQDDARVLSKSNLIASKVADLRAVISENKARNTGKDSLWKDIQTEKTYQALFQHLKLVKTMYGVYEEIDIVDAETGTIIASTQSSELGVKVSGFDFFTKALSFDEIYLNIEKNYEGENDFDLIVSHIIKSKGALHERDKVIAVLILRINTNGFIQPLLHTGGGLGRTGEALLVNQDLKILSLLKHPLPNGGMAVPLEYKIHDKPALLAAQGEEGIIATNDYREVPVLAAYRHIRITSESGWGMVVKQDRSEVFAHLRQSTAYFFLISLAATLLFFCLTYLIASGLSRPIRLLSQTAKQVKAGDFNARSRKTTSDEVGVLADAFNSMLQRIQTWHDELTRTNENLQKEITERKRVEEELTKAKERAEKATKLKDKFLSLVSHDLRAPFASIKGFTRFALDDKKHPLHPFHREMIERIGESADRMLTMIEELLQISRLQSGKIAPKSVFVDGNRAALIAIGHLSQLAKAKGIEMINEVPPETRLFTDPHLFGQVLLNLASNAIKFCNEGDRITFFVPEGKETTIAVKDTGVGMSDKILENLFSHETKTSTAGTQGEKGTGLGLPLSHDIMQALGGSLHAETKKGEGSIFYAELPYVRPLILVVDDEEAPRLLIKNQLENLGADIVEAENGKEALRIMEERAPHLIITDLSMPVMDGFEFLEKIQENPEFKAIPKIVITSFESIQNKEKVLQIGANDFISKSLTTDEFILRVRKFII